MIRKITKRDYSDVLAMGKILNSNFTLDNNKNIYVYEIDGHVVAFLEYSVLYEVADILNIFVKDEYRKKGIGKSLIHYLIDNVRVDRIMLEVRESNSVAIKFYETLNFKYVRSIKNYYGRENGIAMERSLI